MYIELANFKKILGQRLTAIQQVLDDDTLTQIITDNSTLIDDFISQVVTLPLDPIPELIKRICASLSVYDVYTYISWDDLPTSVKSEYEYSLKLLEKIQNKKILLGAQVNAAGENVDLRYEVDSKFYTQRM